MNFTMLVPDVFYADVDALKLFIDFEFNIVHDEFKIK
jgi:hypothetical protein